MSLICAWCRNLTHRTPARSGEAASHGICPSCLRDQLATLRNSAPAR